MIEGGLIRAWGSGAGAWQRAQSALVGVSREAVSRWESGRSPQVDRLARLSDALGVEAAQFVESTPGLRSLRLSKGMSQADLALASGVPRSTVQALEQGEWTIPERVLRQYAAALEVPKDAVRTAAKYARESN